MYGTKHDAFMLEYDYSLYDYDIKTKIFPKLNMSKHILYRAYSNTLAM